MSSDRESGSLSPEPEPATTIQVSQNGTWETRVPAVLIVSNTRIQRKVDN